MTAGLAGSLAALGLGALVVGLAGASRRRRRRRHQAAIDRALGLVLDLVAVVLGAGGTVRQAVTAVATAGPEPVRPAFGAVLQRTAAGHRLPDALGDASADLGPRFHPLLGALLNAELDGAPVGPVLARLTDDVDQRDRWQAEAAAGRLGALLIPPLIVCLLPAVLLGAVVPLVIVALRGVRW